MSDTSNGVGWWKAPDGKWYPPESHPSYGQPFQNPIQIAPPYDIDLNRPQGDLFGPPVYPSGGTTLGWSPSASHIPEQRPRRHGLALMLAAVLLVAAIVGGFVLSSHPTASTHASTAAAPRPAFVTAPSPEHLVVGRKLTLPPALFLANPPGSRVLVTPEQARRVAATMWQLWLGALINSNTTALTRLVAPGPLLTGELYGCAWPRGGCIPDTKIPSIIDIEPVVPAQGNYPISFLAQVINTDVVQNIDGQSSDGPASDLVVLTKTGQSAPWQLSFDATFSGVDGQPPTILSFDESPSSNASGLPSGTSPYNPVPTKEGPMPSSGFLPALAAYWQTWKDTGSAPSSTVFRDDGETSGAGEYFASSPQGYVVRGRWKFKGVVHSYAYQNHYAYQSDPQAHDWVFSAYGGYPMVCGYVQASATASPLGVGPLIQNLDRTNWGMQLAPGLYSSITSVSTHEACVFVVNSGLDAVGDVDDNLVNVTGTTTPTGTLASVRRPSSRGDDGPLKARH
jgi:hypothetical protein